ncbi:MAG: hypothetical protein EPN89_11870 [Methylovulum sp.]|nr:MAG: hypothetical protein EPN89_11870 [Methylovulum sp.]
MTNFTDSLTPLISATKALAIAQHIERLHKDFALLAELTQGATTYKEIAQRFVDRALIDTFNPSDSVFRYQNIAEEFTENVADLLWMPERDPLWCEGLPIGYEHSAPLQNYLSKTGGQRP